VIVARDLYSRIVELDEATLRTVADVLELRGRHPQQAAIRDAYLASLGDIAGKQVLDVGCGTGVVTRELGRRVGPNGQVTGADPSPVFVEVAEGLAADNALSNVSFGVQDGRALLFADATFDLTTAVTVLCHVPERTEVLSELARVTRPGGTVLIMDGEYAANQVEHPDRALTTRIVDAWRASVVDDPYLMRRIIPMIEAAGLEPGPVHGHIHVEAGRVDEATSFIWQWALFASRQAVGAGAVDEGEAGRWIEELGAMNQRGELFGSVTYVSVVALRQ
jgi:ubiquinone/menaquinone biosynthesis C-methylase UbiE